MCWFCTLVSEVSLIGISGSFLLVYLLIFLWSYRSHCWRQTSLIAFKYRLYEKFGESALRSLIRFYPSILPSDIMQLCHHSPTQFLAYLDSLVKSRPEDQRWEGCVCRHLFLLTGHCFSLIRCHIFTVDNCRVEAHAMKNEVQQSSTVLPHFIAHIQIYTSHTSFPFLSGTLRSSV